MKKALTDLAGFTIDIFNLFKDGIGKILLGLGAIIGILVVIGIAFALGSAILIPIIGIIRGILNGVNDPYFYLKAIGVSLFFLFLTIALLKN